MRDKRTRSAPLSHPTLAKNARVRVGHPVAEDEITLGFRAFDVHELLLHFIAVRLGYYRDSGLKVRLRDLTFVTDYREHALSVACGSALVARAKGIMQKVVFIGTDYPMFWIYGNISTKSAKNAEGTISKTSAAGAMARIATFPPLSPPWYFLPVVLRKQGIDLEKAELLPVRDDVGRLGLLRAGAVDAAVISSAFPPAKMKRFGFTPLIFFGDNLRIPTTGLTASDEMIRTNPELLQRVVGSLARSLRAVRESPEEVVKIMADILGEDQAIAQKTYELIAPYFSGDGTGNADSRRRAVEFANAELAPAQPLKEEDVYDFRFVA
jgi:ABC-type nitrate/sulfonate/bicarbonate transport system substrate-binding protein